MYLQNSSSYPSTDIKNVTRSVSYLSPLFTILPSVCWWSWRTISNSQIHTLRITMESFHRWCIHLLHPRIRNFNHWIYHLRTRFLVHHLDLLDCFVSFYFFYINCQSGGGRLSGTERHLPFWENIRWQRKSCQSTFEVHARRTRDSNRT